MGLGLDVVWYGGPKFMTEDIVLHLLRMMLCSKVTPMVKWYHELWGDDYLQNMW